MIYGVALNLSQAKAIIRHKFSAGYVISFCPAASHLLENNHYKIIPAVHHYRVLSHAKAAVLIERDLARIRPVLKDFYSLADGEAQNLTVYLFHFLSIAYYVYFSTRFYNRTDNHFVWISDGGSARQGSYLEMYRDIMEQGKSKITSYANPNFSYPHYLLADAFNKILALILRIRNKKKIISFGDELPKKTLNAVAGTGNDFVMLAPKKISKNIYKSFRLFLKSCKRSLSRPAHDKPIWIFKTCDPKKYTLQADIPNVSFKYKEIASATGTAIKSYIPFLKAEYEIGKNIIDLFKPEIAISDFAKYPHVLAAQERMGLYKGICVMMNHGTHTIQYDPISKIAAKLWASQDRVITPFITDHVPKSPLTYELAKEIRHDRNYRLHKINLFQEINKHPAAADEFMILHAGNFMDVYYHIPWCKETSEEYLLGIFELLEEIKHIDGVKFVIKLKAKKAGIHHKLIQDYIDRLALNDKAMIDTSTGFSELLAKTSLVISNLSGTVEEALINHIPVMIHTYYKQYFHIPEHILSGSGLNPAYLAKDRASIIELIEFTKKNRNSLFNPKLYEKVAWQKESLINVNDFASELVSLCQKK